MWMETAAKVGRLLRAGARVSCAAAVGVCQGRLPGNESLRLRSRWVATLV